MRPPPVAGMHGRHRIFDTPGPTGWNDHGDPCHARRTGPTPGSLGVNDHGTPSPGPAALLLPEHRRDVGALINRIVEEVNAAAHSHTEQALQACLVAVKNGGIDRPQAAAARCAEAYFSARLNAFRVRSGPTGGTGEQDPWRNAVRTGGVEYRTPGAFFQPLGSQSSVAPLGLSYERISQSPPARDAGLAARDSTAFWIEKGAEDGSRDRADTSGTLRPYAPVR